MTYPPPPGQGGWGQQPPGGPQPQPGFGPQPGGQYPPSGPQPGGQYPPSGPQPGGQYPPSGPQPGGQYPPSGPQPGGPQFQQGYGQQPPGWGQQPTGYGPQQPKKKTGLIVGIAIGAVVLVGGVIGGIFLFAGGASAQSVAEDVVDKLNAQDWQGVNELTCQEKREDVNDFRQEFDPTQIDGAPKDFTQAVKLRFGLQGEVTENGDTATGTLTVKMTNIPSKYDSMIPESARSATGDFKMIQEGGWKICQLSESR